MLEMTSVAFNSRKSKYTILDQIFKYSKIKKAGVNGSVVNIYIDMESITKPFYKPGLGESVLAEFENLKGEDEFTLTSEFVNLIGHYRHYFASRLHCNTRFILFYSDQKATDMSNIFPEYRKHYYETRLVKNRHPEFDTVNKVIEKNMNTIKATIAGIPNAYIINTWAIEPTLLPSYFIENQVPLFENTINDFNVILSNNDIFLQDIYLNNNSNTAVLELKGDDSKLITKENILPIILKKSKKDPSFYNGLSGSALTVVNAMIAHKAFDIKSIGRYAHVSAYNTVVRKSVDNKTLLDAYYSDAEDAFNAINGNIKDELKDSFVLNFNLTNHRNAMNRVKKDIAVTIESQLIDVTDLEGLKMINNTYFTRNPIILDNLFEGTANNRRGYNFY